VRASPLARILFGVYVGLTVYASLYPLEGWRDHGLSPFAYLSAPWPRYVTTFDVAINLVGYVPFGFLFVAAFEPRFRGARALLAATVCGFALSLVMEAIQSYLPARVAMNVDLLFNTVGAAAGAALGVVFAPALAPGGPAARLRTRAFLPGAGVDVGLVILGLWLFTQLNPATLLFAAGDLRDLLAAAGRARRPEFFVAIEAFTAAANLVGVALLLSALTRAGQPVRVLFVGLVVLALAVKTGAFAILGHAENVLAWLTPGARLGLGCGLAAGLAAVALPQTVRLAAAAVLIMAATVMVNLAPPNPYLADSLKVWQQGHFLNFNGLTRLVSGLWAFAALAYLIYLAARRREDGPS
jgi:VanZ family protein